MVEHQHHEPVLDHSKAHTFNPMNDTVEVSVPTSISHYMEPELCEAFRQFIEEAGPRLGVAVDFDQPRAYVIHWDLDGSLAINCYP